METPELFIQLGLWELEKDKLILDDKDTTPAELIIASIAHYIDLKGYKFLQEKDHRE